VKPQVNAVAARGLTHQAYGYPAANPFNGQTLWSCSGAVASVA